MYLARPNKSKLPNPRKCRIARILPRLLFAFGLPVALLPLSSALVGIGPAHADLQVCNQTDSQVGIAVGYKGQNGWITEGWWNLTPKGCEVLLSGPLVARYYYIYGVDYDLGGEWTGTAFMCTRDQEFTIAGTENCVAQGNELTGFLEIDTGSERQWTVQLTEPTEQGIGGR